ncbi:MAG: penicillin-binding protein activator [Burkholderiaceae bacterium]|nr:penicillin-binding protein activator [Burkholderiaceae bacterium]
MSASAPSLPTQSPLPVVLVLPAPNTPFARAADAVQEGFFAAHRTAPAPVSIQVIRIEDDAAHLRSALAGAAQRGARLAIGPLTRSLANSLGEGRVSAPLPIVTLNLPEQDAALAPDTLAFGLAIETEARHAVALAVRELPPARSGAAARFLLLTGESALARRMTVAFQQALREHGERAVALQVKVGYGVLQTLEQQLAQLQVEAVLAALDAREAAFLRPRLPPQLPMYATSQVNLGEAAGSLLAAELQGVRFVDMPWLLAPEHPAVAIYPRPKAALSAELQRLYALGIDAYRLMAEWLQGRRAFELDGVTGWLRVQRERSPRVERQPMAAVFRDGRPQRLEGPR